MTQQRSEAKIMNTLTTREIDNILNANGYDTLVDSNEYGDSIWS